MYSCLGDYTPPSQMFYQYMKDAANDRKNLQQYTQHSAKNTESSSDAQYQGGCKCQKQHRYFNQGFTPIQEIVPQYEDKPYFTYHPHMRTPLEAPFAQYEDNIVEYFPRRRYADSYSGGYMSITTVLHVIIIIVLVLILFSIVMSKNTRHS